MSNYTVRRVVTGHNAEGTAICVSDDNASNFLERENRPGVKLVNLWQTTSTPAQFDGPEETVAGDFVLHPPKNGTVFRTIEFMPEDPEFIAKVDGQKAFADMGASKNIVVNARHPYMHRTDTVDYAIVLSGEIYMLMDEEDVLLKTGDTVVQRGTNHAWANRGTEPCVMAFILIDGVANAE